MNKEITDILSQNAENLEGTFLIANSLKSVKESLLEKLKEQLLKVANDLNLTMIYGINLDRKYSGFRFSHPNLDIDNLQINFSFEQENTQNLIYGIIAKIRTLKTAENPNGTFINKYKEIFNKSYGVVLKNNAWYSAIGSFENPNWGAKEYAEIMNGEMAKKIEIKVKQILDVFKQLDAERYQFEAIE